MCQLSDRPSMKGVNNVMGAEAVHVCVDGCAALLQSGGAQRDFELNPSCPDLHVQRVGCMYSSFPAAANS